MKNINKLMTLALSCLMLLGVFACGEDDLSTNQYQQGVHLNVFGPSPVMRGGTLRFLGSNLDQVKEVVIPGVAPITEIEVRQAGIPSEILVQVPKDGPEVGYVKLVTANGEEITTTTKLTYSEPIEFTSFSPASVMPGDVITIKGDYLNLMHEVIFAEDVVVPETEFLSHTRYEIKVTVPEEACTGRIILSDAQEKLPNWVYSEGELTVGTSTVESISAARLKAGETLTITGTALNLVASVKFNGAEVFAPSGAEEDAPAAQAEESVPTFTVNADGTKLTLAIPAEAASGEVILVMRSGVEVVAAVEEDFQVVVPTDLAVAPAPVKAGAALTISGKDLDLVTGVVFPAGVDGGTFTAEASKLVVDKVPTAAVEGDVTLNMANGMSVTVPYTLVKPAVTAYSANPVNAGAALILTGTDLDLVASVSIGGGAEALPEEGASATALTISVPMDSKNGAVTLTLTNGTKVEAPEISVNEALFCYATELPGEDVELKAGSTMTLQVANIDKLTGVQMNGIDCQYIQSDNSLVIGIPQSAGSGTEVRLISSNGEITYTIDIIPATEVSQVVWSGLTEITWGAGGRVVIPASVFENIPAGAVMTVCYTQKDGVWAQAQINYADWSGITFTEGEVQFKQNLVPTDIYGWFADGILNRETPLVLTQEILDNILAKRADCGDENATDCGIIIQGNDLIFTKVTISYTVSLEQDITNCVVRQEDQSQLMPFPINMSWDDSGRFRILIDKDPCIKDMKLKAGSSTMYFYVTGTGQMQINNAGWTSLTTLAEWSDASTRVMELVLTQDLVDCLKGVTGDGWSSTGLIVQGDGMTVNKITILP